MTPSTRPTDPRARRRLVGVVHLPATPGSPGWCGDLGAFFDAARRDAEALAEGGVDALLIENFGDTPFHGERVPPETIAAMACALGAVRSRVRELSIGVNVLRNDARAGVAICAATGADFLRVNVHVGAMLTDQGLLEGRAAETLRDRARLAPGVEVWADVDVKHAVPLAQRPIGDVAEDAVRRGRADALIVSGRATGHAPDVGDLQALRDRDLGVPLWVGSGLDEHNAAGLLALADGAIVGTAFKRHGRVEAPVDPERVRRLRELVDGLG